MFDKDNKIEEIQLDANQLDLNQLEENTNENDAKANNANEKHTKEDGKKEDGIMEEEINYKDLYIRLLADQQNQQKRFQTELNESVTFSNQRFIKELVPILDTFDLALKYNPTDQGVIMIKKQFVDFLEKYGVKLIVPTVGEIFNPHHHEALGKVANDELNDGMIASVAQAGYLLHDRVIRAARVMIVSNATQTSENDTTENTKG